MARGQKCYWNYGDGINRTYYGLMNKTAFARTVTKDDVPPCASVSKRVTDRMSPCAGQCKEQIDQNPGKVILIDDRTGEIIKTLDIVKTR